jgi:hypothetical protein
MTIINRFCPELSDIVAIQMECGNCHATISYPPAKWTPKALECPSCSVTLVAGSTNNLSAELRALYALQEGLQELLTNKTLKFRLRLALDRGV